MLKYLLSAKHPISSFIVALLYLIFYDYVFRTYMFSVWKYMGVQYNDIPTDFYPIFLIAGAFPVLFYKGLRNIASGFSIMIYFFGILPCYHAVVTFDPIDSFSFWGYIIAFLTCGCLFFLSDSFYLIRRPFTNNRKRPISVCTVEICTIIMLLSLIISYGSQMSFVNFLVDSTELYEKRAENSGTSVLTLVLYFQQWLTNALLPFLLIIYLRQKSLTKIFIVFGAYLAVFMINMQKATIIMPLVITFIYFIISRNKDYVRNYFFSCLTILVIVFSAILLYYSPKNPIAMAIAAIFIMRTVCVEGWLCSLYIPFFQNNPTTNFTHINIVNWFTDAYPYSDSIGRTVTYGAQNANAFFLLMDGVAGAGIIGVLFIGIIFILFKNILNSICLKYDRNLCIIIFFPAIISLINVSMFTAILTCGLMILYILFMYTEAPMLQYNQ